MRLNSLIPCSPCIDQANDCMVTFEEIQTVYYMVAATGVLVAAIDDIYNMRINQKAMKTTLEMIQIQLLKDFNEDLTESFTSMSNYVDSAERGVEQLRRLHRQIQLTGMPGKRVQAQVLGRRIHFFGLMIRDGLIDIDTFMKYIGDTAPLLWDKYKDIILEQERVCYHYPLWMAGFEYLR